MLLYIIKSTFFLATFYLLFKGFLEQRKSHFFKRYYLLAVIIISFTLPLISLSFQVTPNQITEAKDIFSKEIYAPYFKPPLTQYSPAAPSFNFPVVKIAYWFICGLFAVQFLKRLIQLIFLRQTGQKIATKYGIVVLHSSVKTPFSFYNSMYLNTEEWNANTIAEYILLHEQAHIEQKHSLDVILVEILKIFFWFQPFIYIFKKRIQENHEYLADAHCLSQISNIKHYQELILSYYQDSEKNNIALSSSFTFKNIKKRFIMMKNTRKGRVWETVFYSSVFVLGFLGFIGIEAKAAEVKTIENKITRSVQQMVSPDRIATEEKEPPKSAQTHKTSPDSIQEKPIVYYIKEDISSSTVTIEGKEYKYLVDASKKVTFYLKGKKIRLDADKYTLVDLDQIFKNSKHNSYSTGYFIFDEEKYDKIAVQEYYDDRKITRELISGIKSEVHKDSYPDNYTVNMNFKITIDENGYVTDVEETTNSEYEDIKAIKTFFRNLPRWVPAVKNGKNVASECNYAYSITLNETFKK